MTNYNTDFFKTCTDQMYYILGLIYADGNLSKNKSTFSITLHKDDQEHLKKIAALLRNDNKVFFYRNVCNLYINNQKMYRNLLDWGLYPNKSKTLMPHPDLKYNRHFWRGCIDGDGCVSFKCKSLSFCGTEEMVNGLIEFINLYNKKAHPSFQKGKGDNFGSVLYQMNNPSNILDIFYGELREDDIFLPRKYQEYVKIKHHHQEKLNKRKIYQYDINGNFIRYYNDIHEASKLLQVSKDMIHRHNFRKSSFLKGGIVIKEYIDSPENVRRMFSHLKGTKYQNERII